MSGPAPLRRFLLLVLVPALVTCIGIARTADDTRRERRDAVLSRAGGMLSTAVQADLAEAWRLLEAEAAPVEVADTTIAAVRRARAGDTVRALGTDAAGARASVLFPRGDTLVSATAVVRAPVIPAAAEFTPLDAALYLQGVRLQPPLGWEEAAGDPAGNAAGSRAGIDGQLPPRVDPTPGWTDEYGLWLHPATASLGSAASELVVAIRPTTRPRGSASLRTIVSASLLLLLSLGLVASSAGVRPVARTERVKFRGRVLAGVTLAALTTAVISIAIALGADRRAAADGVRELEIVAGLVEARGLMDDPEAAREWTGSPVYAVRDGVVAGDTGEEPAPEVVTDTEPPEAGRPTTGVDEVRWRAVATPFGYTVFLGDPVRTPPLLPLALGGTLITLLGAVVVVRSFGGERRSS